MAQFLWDYKVPIVTTMAVVTGIFIARKWSNDSKANVVLKAHPEHPNELKVTTYNVLAQDYVFDKGFDKSIVPPQPKPQYKDCDQNVLDPAYRHAGLIKELRSSDDDILCLQEVEADALFKTAEITLKSQGYVGIYTKKAKNVLDGCALFYKKNSVEELSRRDIVYKDGSGHIAQLVILNYQGQYLGVVNTHLKYDPEGNDAFAQQELEEVLAVKKEYPHVTAWMICGDFNVTETSKALQKLRDNGFTTKGTEKPTCKALITTNGVASLQNIRPDYIFTTGLDVTPLDVHDIKSEAVLPAPNFHSDHIKFSVRAQLPQKPS
jgi:mRNA deadenylase 3'-5' endonuclease subunit Ccr4